MTSLVPLQSSIREDDSHLQDVVAQTLECARLHGASSCAAGVVCTQGYELTVRMGELETIEHQNGKGLTVTVYLGNRKGISTTSDLDRAAVEDTVRAACAIAKHTAEDPCNGLPPQDRLAREFPDLEQCLPWNLDRDLAFSMALSCEDAARGSDSRIVNSEGATVATTLGDSAFGNSDGFLAGQRHTSHYVACSVVGESEAGMQRDYWFSSACDPAALEAPEAIGEAAARRTVRRLNARQLKTRQAPVLFEAPVASSLLSHFVGAINGTALYRKASFLLDSIGKPVFSQGIRVHEQPHLKRTMGSAAFDAEGVATQARDLVTDGVLNGYVLGSYSARKLGMETTGNAGGVFNITIDSGDRDFDAMLKQMDTGLLVTELIGFGVNTVTGDYSRGASGFWVEGGEIRFPVEEITIAGNMSDMFRSIVSVGADVDYRKRIRTGSILLENMAIAGG